MILLIYLFQIQNIKTVDGSNSARILVGCKPIYIYIIYIQGGPKVSTHTLGLIAPPCFTFESCCFADDILYLLFRGFRRQNSTTPIQYQNTSIAVSEHAERLIFSETVAN